MTEDHESSPGRSTDLRLRGRSFIPEDEIEELASRAGGPGGQHVNTSATRVTLRWSLRETRGLSPAARARAEARLRGKLTRDGVLVVHAARHRSRERNREQARERLRELVDAALEERPARRPTAPTKGARRRRLERKRQRGALKSRRSEPPDADG